MGHKHIISHYSTVFLTVIVWFLLDFTTKWWVKSESFQPQVFIENIFEFTSSTNTGIAFGIQLNQSFQIVASLLLIIILTWAALHSAKPGHKKWFLNQLLFGIIIGGAIGNLVDRIIQGYVVDFIVLGPIPTFNVADIGITIGLIALAISSITENKSTHRVKK